MGREVLLDPTLEEEKWSDGEMMVTYMASRKEVTQLTLTGEWPDTSASDVCKISAFLVLFSSQDNLLTS